MPVKNITIIGVGLLGGSIGLGLHAAGVDCRLTGFGHRRSTLDRAAEFGAIDRVADSIADAVAQADLVILCTPVGAFESMLQEIAPHLPANCLVTDVGSTKRTVVRLAETILPRGTHFVGSHPMAGSEKRGVEYARADLFTHATCILTPTAATHRPAVAAIDGFWKSLSMQTVRMSPEEHDSALSDISHLPHLLAGALVKMQADGSLPLAGKGFMDTTRIASGDSGLWRDILLDNRDNIKASLSRLQSQLSALEKLLDPKKGEALASWLAEAAQRRDGLAQRKLREISPD
jgi:cyclohexadieny/prephenate dehydrogenase